MSNASDAVVASGADAAPHAPVRHQHKAHDVPDAGAAVYSEKKKKPRKVLKINPKAAKIVEEHKRKVEDVLQRGEEKRGMQRAKERSKSNCRSTRK
ncbi:MAG: hypothetical protein KF742_01715 [Cryobacterium sp.]|nr:hypothetical protein [Cryobacterium sp.]